MVKRTITVTTILLILTMAVGLIVMLNKPSFGADIASGTCGTCSWVIDSEGVLTISPTDGVSGTLAEFNYSSYKHDWNTSTFQNKIKKLVVENGVKTGQGCYSMFGYLINCTEIDLSGIDTSNAKIMEFMFRECYKLTSIDVSNFNTSNVTNMSFMFYKCSGLEILDVSGFDTSNVIYMNEMFSNCKSLTSIDVSMFNTENVTNMEYMFCECQALTSINLLGIDTSKVSNMSMMFYNCRLLTSIDVSGFDTSNVTNMSAMFSNCRVLSSINISGFDTSNVTNMGSMFSDCQSLTSVDVSGFNTENVTTMVYMFSDCYKLTPIDVSNFNTSKVINMSYMFSGCYSAETINVSNFDTSNVTNMGNMFKACRNIQYLDISSFNTSKTTDMNSLFLYSNNLDMIKLGENFSFDGDGNITLINYKALLPTPTGEEFTGKWIREDGAYGPYTPEELRDNYDGSTMAGNWIRERKPLTVTYSYTGTTPQGASELPETQIYPAGAEVTVAPDAIAPGYTFSGWSRTGTFIMPEENVEITGSFTANTDTPYKVKHYVEDLNADTFSLRETENLEGETDSIAVAYEREYEGFAFDTGASSVTGTISGDGNLTLKLYYTRNSYTVSYSYTSAPVSADLLPANQSYEYEAEVTVAPAATAPGYTFSGWNRTGTFTMPAEDVEITGSFTANTNTPYKVEHYIKDLNANTYTLRETENKTGTTDTLVTATAKTYEGFTFNNSINGTVQSRYISGDGNLTLKLYYTRNSYNVSYAYTSAPVSASLLPADQSYQYGAEVTVEADATAPGYTFSGWSRTNTFTMPAEDVEITGSFTANTNTPYKIKHYTKDLNVNTYTLRETENKTGTTDTLVTAIAKTYEGFTFNNSINGTVQSGYISGDGNLVLKLYYNRNSYTVSYEYQGNVPAGASSLPASQSYEFGAEVTVAQNATAPGYTFNGWNRTGTFAMPAEDVTIKGSFASDSDTTYKVEHYKENINSDTYSLFETDTLAGETDTEITVTPNTYVGFTFDSGRSTTTGTITGDGNLTLKLYYNRNLYTVSYAYQGTVPTGASSLPASQSYEYGADVIVAPNATAQGYTFSGWSRTGTFTMPAEDVEITGSFTTNTNTSYKIEHYTKDLNASTYTLRETENKSGTTDTSITATPKNYEGFTFDAGTSTQTGTISGDGNLTLKLYYNRNSYTVSYAYQGTVPTGASSLPASQSYEYGADVIVAPNATAQGYTFSGWSRTGTFTMPAEDVEITGSFTTNTNTSYKIEHYTKDLNASTYTLRETENKSGTTDTSITATPKNYEGFTFDAGTSTQTGTISGDGNLTLKLYYNRNSYTVSYAYTSAPVSADLLPANQSYEYGAEVTVAADSTALGYTFSGWSRTGTFTMPAQDVEITGSFDANTNTAYKVEYYLEIEHSGEYILKDEYSFTGKTDTEVNAELKEYSGFRQDNSIDGTKKTGTITGDGSLVLKLYYKNINYKYKVEYYFDGELDSALEEILDGEIDSQVSSNPVTPVRYGEKSYTLVSKNHKITISTNDEDNIIKVYYETDVLDYEIDNSGDATEGDGIPDKYQIQTYYKVENGTWDDGTTRQKTSIVTLRDDSGELSEQGTGELTAPQVGSKPTKGYTKGSWTPELPSKVSKANDGEEYKYSYKEQGEIEEQTKEEPKTEVTQKEAKSSNPKTQDIMPIFLLIGTTGIVILMMAKNIKKKYSRKAKKVQY